jgi:hypothetical protein
MFKQRKRYNKTPSRRKIPGVGAETYRGTRTPISLVLQASEPPDLHTLAIFDQPVIYADILPLWDAGSGRTPTAVSRVSPTEFDITWAAGAAITDGFTIEIPFEDPSFRNQAAGYVRIPVVTTVPPPE